MSKTRSGSVRETEVNQVAWVRELTAGRYRVMVTGAEFALIKNALSEAERTCRFGMEVLADVDARRDSAPAPDSRLRREIEALAMREASLRSLQKTMSEIDRGGKPDPTRDAGLDELRSGAAVQVPRPR